MRECTAIIYTLTEYEFLILASKDPTVLFTGHKPNIFFFTQGSTLIKYGKNPGKHLALPDTLSRNTPPELLT